MGNQGEMEKNEKNEQEKAGRRGMKKKNPDEMNIVLGNTLQIGVILSALVIAAGLVLFLLRYSSADASAYIAYNPDKVPHGDFSVGLSSIASGLVSLNPFSVIELGLLILLATPVTRVFLSILLFHFEGDRKYVYITLGVLSILLFSIFVAPFIP